MGDVNIIALVVAVVGAGGIGAAIREVVNVVTLARQGLSGREDRRRSDIVAQRDAALAQAKDAEAEADRHEARADDEADKRRQAQELAARYRLQLIRHGIQPAVWSDIDETTDPLWGHPEPPPHPGQNRRSR